jgi:hypothetical protein
MQLLARVKSGCQKVKVNRQIIRLLANPFFCFLRFPEREKRMVVLFVKGEYERLYEPQNSWVSVSVQWFNL